MKLFKSFLFIQIVHTLFVACSGSIPYSNMISNKGKPLPGSYKYIPNSQNNNTENDDNEVSTVSQTNEFRSKNIHVSEKTTKSQKEKLMITEQKYGNENLKNEDLTIRSTASVSDYESSLIQEVVENEKIDSNKDYDIKGIQKKLIPLKQHEKYRAMMVRKNESIKTPPSKDGGVKFSRLKSIKEIDTDFFCFPSEDGGFNQFSDNKYREIKIESFGFKPRKQIGIPLSYPPSYYRQLNSSDVQQIDIAKREILRIFKVQYNENIAIQILKAFIRVITEEQFDELETIKDDLDDYESSAILESIWNDITAILPNPTYDKKQITKRLQDILIRNENDYRKHQLGENSLLSGNNNVNLNSDEYIVNEKEELFAIKDFTFTISQKDVIIATELFKTECAMICTDKPDPDPNISERQNMAEYKSLCIAKGVDLRNGYPILKWLLDSFSRDQVNGHKILFKNENVPFDKYRFDADKYLVGYHPTAWWLHDNAFCKYIQYKNKKMALPMLTAVQALSKLALPQLNYNPRFAQIIHDNLNDFVKYTFASWAVIYRLIKSIENADLTTLKNDKQNMQFNFTPAQIDFWIIPQLVKPRKMNYPVFYLRELLLSNDESDGDYNDNDLYLFYGNTENKFNKMGKVANHEKVLHPLWDLEKYLKKDGYRKNIDYWCDYLEDPLRSVEEKIHNMILESTYSLKKTHLLVYRFLLEINKHKTISSDIVNLICLYTIDPCWIERNTTQYRRYIFIIDRRNPKNLEKQNMGYIKPNYFKTSQDWPDKIYLVRSKIHEKEQITKKVRTAKSAKAEKVEETAKEVKAAKSIKKISEHFISVPEVCLGYSKEYLFPNTEDSESGPIGITDALNGYKFALSYHLLEYDSCKAYWYINKGSQKFELDDMEWLWTRFFHKIENKEQILSDENKIALKKYIYEKRLPDDKFNEFWRQTHEMK